MRHLVYNVRYSVVQINSSLLTTKHIPPRGRITPTPPPTTLPPTTLLPTPYLSSNQYTTLSTHHLHAVKYLNNYCFYFHNI